MNIQTPRLLLKPLSKQQLQAYILDDFSLEESLNLICGSRTVSERVKSAIETKIIPRLTEQVPHDWYVTFLTVIYKEQQVMVADLCFKGEPNAQGEIEIGYGTYPDFQQQGFMTEAVEGIIGFSHKTLLLKVWIRTIAD